MGLIVYMYVCVALHASSVIHPCALFSVVTLVACRQEGQDNTELNIWHWTNFYRYGTPSEIREMLHNYRK